MTIKFISLNMWSGGRLFPQLIDFLRAENADVVALQEVHDSPETTPKERLRSMEVLKRELAYPFQEFAFAFNLSLPEGTFPQGNAVLSKFPIKEHSTVSLFDSVQDEYRDIPEHWPIEPRILQCALLNTPVGEVNVFNVHGVWDLAGDNPSTQRRTMVERMLRAIEDKPNVLLTGDTNASSGNPLLKHIDARLTNVFGRELTTTFNMRRKDKPGYATAAVDHMWVSPSIKVLSKKCPDIDISDHLPLVVTLEI